MTRPSSVSRRWERVRVGLDCRFGCDLRPGDWALWTRAGYATHVLCEAHALAHGGFVPPDRGVFSVDDVGPVDGKQARLGKDA